MKRSGVVLAGMALLAAGAANPAGAKRLSRLAVGETIGPALTASPGPIAFTSEFHGISSFASPHSGPGGPRGLISFDPGGYAELRFPALQRPLRLKCEVGSTLTFLVTQNLGGNRTVAGQIGSQPLPGWITPYLIIDMADLQPPAPQEVTVSFRPDGLLPVPWNLTGCEIQPRP